MIRLPKFSRITKPAPLREFSAAYERCSGLPIPTNYLTSANNRVCGVYLGGRLIGGFILGRDAQFRTLQCFARPETHPELLQRMQSPDRYAEICCFFIEPTYRTNPGINLMTWLYLTYVIRRRGRASLLFGTNSPSLAKLYGQTYESRPFHTDQVAGKRTFLFRASRRKSVRGMLEIIRHKLRRQRRVRREMARNQERASVAS